MQFLQTVPEGFHKSIELLNKVKVDVLIDMSTKTCDFIHLKGVGCHVEDYVEVFLNFDVKVFQSMDMEMKETHIEMVINILNYIFKLAIKQKVSPQDFAKLMRKNSQLTPTNIKSLFEVYEKYQVFFNTLI